MYLSALGYMERQGSGFRKITESYRAACNYREELAPEFYSDAVSFRVTLYNLNYGTAANAANVAIEDEKVAIEDEKVAIEAEKVAIEDEKVAIEDEKVAIEGQKVAIAVAIDRLNANKGTIAKAKAVFENMGFDGVFGRSDIAGITHDSVTAAGNLIAKLKNAALIEPACGLGKGKYKFVPPEE